MNKILKYILIIICILTFCISSYKVIDYFYHSFQSEKKYSELAELIDDEIEDDKPVRHKSFSQKYEKLLLKNPDMNAWIMIEDTKVNYPVMLTPDNEEYYLRKNFDKKYEFRGTLFFNKEAKLSDDNMIIYGHNMDDGTMFGALRKYNKKSYYENHKYINLDTYEGERIYEIAYIFKTVDEIGHELYLNYYDFINYSENEFNEQINKYKSKSYYDTGVDVQYGDKLLTLSTCEYSHDNGRFVIVAKLVENK